MLREGWQIELDRILLRCSQGNVGVCRVDFNSVDWSGLDDSSDCSGSTHEAIAGSNWGSRRRFFLV